MTGWARKRRWVVVGGVLLLLSLLGCSSGATGTPALPQLTKMPSQPTSMTPQPTRTVRVTDTQPSPSPSPRPTSAPDRPHYRISAWLNYATYQLNVSQTITIPNPASRELTELVLVVPPNWQPGVFHLEELTWGKDEPVEEFTLDGIRLRIRMQQAWFADQSRTLSLQYQISLPVINSMEGFGPNPFGYSDGQGESWQRQVNLTDWYPFIPPFKEGEGWVVHEPWYYGEYWVYPTADFDVTLEITQRPQELVVAASSLDEGENGIHRYHLEQARNFVISISPDFQVLEEKVEGTKVLGYIFPLYEEAGKAAFRSTVDALRLFSELYQPYTQPSLTMVQASFDHGMEYEGLYFLNHSFFRIYNGSQASFLVAIAAHETAHQWWYGLVGNDPALEPWLDEAICTYSEKLYFEEYYPSAEEWWWTNRVDYYQPEGVIDRSIYDTVGYLDYRDATYLRGAHFWQDLREALGDHVFFSFLQRYADSFAGQFATGEAFFDLLEDHTEADLELLVNEYFQTRP